MRVGRVLGICTGYQQKLPGAKFSRGTYCGTGQHNPNSTKSSLFIISIFIWNNKKNSVLEYKTFHINMGDFMEPVCDKGGMLMLIF